MEVVATAAEKVEAEKAVAKEVAVTEAVRRVGGTIQQHVACEVMTQRADEYGELGDVVPDGHGDDEVLRRDVHDV